MNAGLYASRNDCCGGHDGLRLVDASHAVTWSSGMCGGTKPTPNDRNWTPVDVLSLSDRRLVTEDETAMHNFHWSQVDDQWIEEKP